jgi:ribosome-binding ATPase YchF (GTP1/OBG family)
VKIGLIGISEINLGKHNIKDSRLDEVDKITKSKKKTYIQVETVGEDSCLEADAILVLNESRTDIILKDLEFIETRISRSEDEKEKVLLAKLKNLLEKEEFIFKAEFSEEEKNLMSAYTLLSSKPVVSAAKEELADSISLLARIVNEAGYVSFFTTGEKETRAWLIKKGTCAWEAAGCIHSDIQKGFIRAEIISFNDFIQLGGEAQAKQAGKMRLEPKEYIMQDADITTFRFNK